MANLLGSAAWGRWSSKCKRVGCCRHPRRTHSGQRHYEDRQWRKDWDEEQEPVHNDWISRFVAYIEARYESSKGNP